MAAASIPLIQMCILVISVYGRASRERLDFFVLSAAYTDAATAQKISMRSFTKQQIASGVALVIAALFVVVLHSLNYSKEHQVYGIALVGVFGFLFLSRDKAQQQDEPWWW
jgi:Na+/H+ antiporter NhaA